MRLCEREGLPLGAAMFAREALAAVTALRRVYENPNPSSSENPTENPKAAGALVAREGVLWSNMFVSFLAAESYEVSFSCHVITS